MDRRNLIFARRFLAGLLVIAISRIYIPNS